MTSQVIFLIFVEYAWLLNIESIPQIEQGQFRQLDHGNTFWLESSAELPDTNLLFLHRGTGAGIEECGTSSPDATLPS